MKLRRVVLWVAGVAIFAVLIFMVCFNLWMRTWKTFESKDGYSLRYPSEWKVGEEEGSVIISKWNLSFQDPGGPGSSGFLIARRFKVDNDRNLDKYELGYKSSPNTKFLERGNLNGYSFLRVSEIQRESALAVQTPYRRIDTTTEFIFVEKDNHFYKLYGAVYPYGVSHVEVFINHLIVKNMIEGVSFTSE